MKRRKTVNLIGELAQIYAFFWPEIGRQKARIIYALLAMLAGVVLQLLEPWPLKIVLDNVFASGPDAAAGNTGPFGMRHLSPTTLLLIAAAAVVLIAAVRGYADFTARVGFFVIGNKTVIRVRDRIFRHLQRLSLGFHSRARGGDLVIRVTRDVSLLRDVTSTAVLPLIASVLVLAGMLGVMFWMRWQLALLSLVTVPLFWLATVKIGHRIRETARKQRRREGAMATVAAEALSAIGTIQALGLEQEFSEQFQATNRKCQKDDLKASRNAVRLSRIVDILLALSSAIVLYYGGVWVLRGSLTPGELVVFLLYLKQSFKPAQNFAKYIARLAKATAAGDRIIDILQTQPRITSPPDGRTADSVAGQICISSASFAYAKKRRVLQGVDLEIAAGETIALVGPSGSGKSTLLSLLPRLHDVTGGQITLDGYDLREYDLTSLRNAFSVVPQDCVLFAGTIRDNIAIAASEPSETQIVAAAKFAAADDFIRALPQGYDTVVGERGMMLSRGQRQRIAIARAAIRQSPILLLDEPTTGIDQRSQHDVLEALSRLSDGRTTVVATHHLPLAKQMDRIAIIAGGTLVDCGCHEELLDRCPEYLTLFEKRLPTSPTNIEGDALVSHR